MALPKEIEERIRGYINRCKWNWAKTYKTTPHEYIVRFKSALCDFEFVDFVKAQRQFGTEQWWGKYYFPYLFIDGYKYWTMGSPISETTIINRQKIFSEYDQIASVYDTLFKDNASLEQDGKIADMLYGIEGSVLDLGCGTGLLLDLVEIAPERYRGIDPSREMLTIFKDRHPLHARKLCRVAFEEDADNYLKFDNVVALYGSASYVMPVYMELFAANHKGCFLMFYRNGYYPATYQKTGIEMHHFYYDRRQLQKMFPDCEVTDFDNYYIVTNIKPKPKQLNLFG